jgi:hypothetical protein
MRTTRCIACYEETSPPGEELGRAGPAKSSVYEASSDCFVWVTSVAQGSTRPVPERGSRRRALTVPVDVVLDRRLSITSIRLYGILRCGHSLYKAAELMKQNVDHLRRAERALIRYGYVQRVSIRSAGGRDDSYRFLEK